MNDYYWSTKEELPDNSCVMCDFIEYENTTLDIYLVDGTYAEGVDSDGVKWEVHASGNGDFFNHKIEFKLLGDNDE